MAQEKSIKDGREASRAEGMFMLFYQLGPNRSVKKLHDYLIENGDKISYGSLKRYSMKYDWYKRAAGMNVDLRQRQERTAVDTVVEINRRHARIAVAMQSVGEHQLNRFQDMIDQKEELDIKPREVISLVEYGAKLERLATGQQLSS